MYAFFPFLLTAMACGLLGAWLVHDAGLRRQPGLARAGWCLVAVLPLALLGLLLAGLQGGTGPGAPRGVRDVLLGGAAALLLLAGLFTLWERVRARRAAARGPARPGLLGPTLLIPALGAIMICFLLSLLLALTNGTLGF